jgi:hypothetical protein
VVLDPNHQILDVLMRVDAVKPARRDDALQYHEVLGTLHMPGE